MINEKIAGPIVESKVGIACFKAIEALFEVAVPVVLANDICYEGRPFRIPITWDKMCCR